MNKFKKIGFSALAGSLVAVSANAGEMSVAGSASVALEHINGGAASAGKSWSMGNQLTFSGSGELDNGMNVSLSFIIDQGDDETDTGVCAQRPRSFCDQTPAEPPKSIRFKDTKSRWGSCSSTGSLMVNWRLIMAPPSVYRYVAIHEVSHLKYMKFLTNLSVSE